eukprot:2116491-Prymnesium_polylepis.1
MSEEAELRRLEDGDGEAAASGRYGMMATFPESREPERLELQASPARTSYVGGGPERKERRRRTGKRKKKLLTCGNGQNPGIKKKDRRRQTPSSVGDALRGSSPPGKKKLQKKLCGRLRFRVT